MKLLGPATLGLALFFAACSSDERPSSDAGPRADTGGGQPDATADADAASSPDAEPEVDAGSTRDPSCAAGAHWLTTVRGRIVGEDNMPSPGSKAQLCSRIAPSDMLLCLRPVDIDATGAFEIAIPANARCVRESTMRLVQPTGDFTVGYCPLDLAIDDESYAVPTPFTMFATQRATTIPPEGDMMMSRTVVFPGGLEMDLIPRNYFPGSGGYADLAAATIPPASSNPCIQAGEAPFDGIFGFSPEGDYTMGRVAMRLPNTAGLAANTPVDIFVLGGLACTFDNGDLLPEGKWAKIESSAVSADGMTIPVTPGAVCLSWIAYRHQ